MPININTIPQENRLHILWNIRFEYKHNAIEYLDHLTDMRIQNSQSI
jgi:hypothetical protein